MRIVISVLTFVLIASLQADPAPPQKKILILSSHGGFGHTAAVNTLKAILKDDYSITVIHPIDEIKIWGIPSGEMIYNKFLSMGWIRLVNFASQYIAPKMLHRRGSKVEELITKYIKEEKPQLVISLIPFINYPASEAARKANSPFLIITTDNDLKNWIHDVEKITHPNFMITIGADAETTKGLLVSRHIPADRIKVIGLPLRTNFLENKNQDSLREEYKIQKKSVVLIMMGGAGCTTAYEYAKNIIEKEMNLHLIVVAGKNAELAESLKLLTPHSSNSLQVVGFTDRVADLMAVSNLIITKPGPGTINEAIHMKLPILIDDSAPHLYWEKANSDLVASYKVGEHITLKENITATLSKYLANKVMQGEIQKAFEQVPPNRFHLEIKNIIEQLCD